MKKKDHQLAAVTPEDLWVMLLSTIRYSLGRSSYITSWAAELAVRYEAFLRYEQLVQLADEVEHELAVAEVHDRTVGMPCDHAGWKKLARDLRTIALRRPAI